MTLLMLLVLVAVTYEAIRAGTILEQPGYNSDRLFDLNMVGYIFLFYNGRVMDTFKVAKYILSLKPTRNWRHCFSSQIAEIALLQPRLFTSLCTINLCFLKELSIGIMDQNET